MILYDIIWKYTFYFVDVGLRFPIFFSNKMRHSNDIWIAKIGFDTAKNWPSKIWHVYILRHLQHTPPFYKSRLAFFFVCVYLNLNLNIFTS